ncbi:MAG: hypothetical protein WKF75_07990 [Singulisphaera sp.]
MWHGSAAVATALAGFGLTWLAQSSVLLVLGLLAGRVLRRSGPAVQSGVYRTTLAAVLVCPVVSALLGAAGFDGLTLRLPSPPAEAAIVPVLPVATLRPLTVEVVRVLPVVTPAEPVSPSPSETRGSTTSQVEPSPPPARPQAHPTGPAAGVVLGLAVWLLGSAVMGLRLLVGQRRMVRLRASAVPAEAGVGALCRDLAGQLGLRALAVLRSPFLFSPCLDGLRRPAILLPDDVEDNLRETFVHELALARRDGLWNLLGRTASRRSSSRCSGRSRGGWR